MVRPTHFFLLGRTIFMKLREMMAPKKRKTTSEPIRVRPLPQNYVKFNMSTIEELFNCLSIHSIVLERGFHNHNPNYRMFMYSRQHWKEFRAHPSLGIAPIVREFHANLKNRAGFTVFMRWVWVPFDSATINRVLGLSDVESNEYRELFRSLDYDTILKMVAGANASWKTKKDGGFMR